jgi:head-tail adaptor
MNAYTQLLYYIKELADEDGYINTVTKNGSQDIDLDKGNIYPLFDVNVGVDGTFPSTAMVRFSVELVCVSVRDISDEVNTDKFWMNDNEVDNHNETLASLMRIWAKMNRNFEQNDIVASEEPSLSKDTFQYKNILDGWRLNFDVEMPMIVNLCDGCK